MAKRQTTTEQAVDGSGCPHFWRIDSPNGPTSVGTCKTCGEKREFTNSLPGTGWDRGTPESRRNAQNAAAARASAARTAASAARNGATASAR